MFYLKNRFKVLNLILTSWMGYSVGHIWVFIALWRPLCWCFCSKLIGLHHLYERQLVLFFGHSCPSSPLWKTCRVDFQPKMHFIDILSLVSTSNISNKKATSSEKEIAWKRFAIKKWIHESYVSIPQSPKKWLIGFIRQVSWLCFILWIPSHANLHSGSESLSALQLRGQRRLFTELPF